MHFASRRLASLPEDLPARLPVAMDGNVWPENAGSAGAASSTLGPESDSLRLECPTCGKLFAHQDQLVLHMHVHVFTGDRTAAASSRADDLSTNPAAGGLANGDLAMGLVSRDSSHAVIPVVPTSMPAAATTGRPFKCTVCSIAFRVMGHLGKHFRSKSHLRALEKAGLLKASLLSRIHSLNIRLQDIIDQETGFIVVEALNKLLCQADPTGEIVTSTAAAPPPPPPPLPHSAAGLGAAPGLAAHAAASVYHRPSGRGRGQKRPRPAAWSPPPARSGPSTPRMPRSSAPEWNDEALAPTRTR